jgi:hypothetical protein
MNVTDWNAIVDAYSEMDDPEERAVLTFIRGRRELHIITTKFSGNGGTSHRSMRGSQASLIGHSFMQDASLLVRAA